MKETGSDVALTQPLNSNAAEFRAQLDALQQAETQGEVPDATEEQTAEADTESISEEDSEGDSPDSASHDDMGDDSGESDPRGPIPPSRLKKETLKRKALEEQMAIEREQRIRAQTELELINRALQQMHNPPGMQPPPQNDGFEPLDQEAHQFYNQQYALKDEVSQLRAEVQNTRMGQALDHQQAIFEQTHPDFRDAYAHLYKTEIESINHVTGDEQHARYVATAKLANIARTAATQGKNVAEVFYKMAKSYGYVGKAKPQSQPIRNLEAIESNMRKSKVADVPAAAVSPGNGAGQYATLENFNKMYSGTPADREANAKKFREHLDRIRRGG